MESVPRFFDQVDTKLERIIDASKLSPGEELTKKYMLTQGIAANTGFLLFLLLAWIINAKMLAEFCLVYIPFMIIEIYLCLKSVKTSRVIFYFKIAMIVISSIYVVRMGGLLTSGGLFLLSVQAVTSTAILRDLRKILTVSIVFVVVMMFLFVFEPLFPTRYALNPQQNSIAFTMSIVFITGYIFFFSLYSSNLYSKLEQRETQRQKELNDAKTRLYTNITHEFRTPLTVILGMADSLKKNGQNNIPEKMDTITKNGKNLLQLVDQMLDLSKLESGRMSVNKISANIIPFLKYAFQLQEFYAEEKNISMHFFSESQSYEIEFDPEKTAAIVSNLLRNAIKFTSNGGQISMKVFQSNEKICIEIKDNGIGVPQEKLETIFDRFYQVDGANTRKEGGAGIGLAVTRELVNLLKGSIEVKSNPGLGTIFTVKLPYIPAVEKSLAIADAYEETELWEDQSDPADVLQLKSNGHQRLLIIEDNPDVIGYLKACYQNQFSIHTAKDGKEGFQLAIEEIPDIIISDVMMPEMDGFELCEKLKEDYRTSHIPIILLTAKADIPSRIEGLETGADAYIVKPFNQRELLVRMQKLLELRRKLFRRYSSGNSLEFSSNPVIQKEDRFFKKLNEIILTNLGDEFFTIQVLCDEMAMSKSQLYRKFNALTNIPAAKYIRTLRMKKAKELLQTTSMNITEVGYEVGMKSVSGFSKLFKEEFGYSPTDFVKENLTTIR